MTSFLDMIKQDAPEYKFVIKLAVMEVTPEMIDSIVTALTKYEYISASKFTTTPIMENPIDFPELKNMPVHIANVSFKYPCTPNSLKVQISSALSIPMQSVVVYGANDPRLPDIDLFNNTEKEEYVPKAGTQYSSDEEPSIKDATLQDQSMNLLKVLADKAAENAPVEFTNSLIPAAAKSDVPKDYAHYDNKSGNEPSLFGKLKVEKAYKYIRK